MGWSVPSALLLLDRLFTNARWVKAASSPNLPFGKVLQRPKAAVPAVVFFQGGIELGFAEVRPERGGDHQLGVRNLPEEEVADSHLTAGADEHVRVRKVSRVEMLAKNFLGDVRGVEFAVADLLSEAAHGVHNFGASPIAERHDQSEPIIFSERGDGLLEMLLDEFGQPVNLADDFEPDIVFVQLGGLGLEIMDQVLHEGIDLVFRPVPVFDGKGVKGKVLDGQLAGSANDDAGGFSAGAMALDPGEVPLPGPAAIAIHDDGNVAG
ncbi:hypothetical protein SBV1_2320021 [Verrucomicrobia bacterium]|nr:hypothetical protein SBV1_2320021 [Verrucomicrobiota bacterium]